MVSSLRVTPAAGVPKTVFDNGGKLVIVNLDVCIKNIKSM